MYKLYDFMEARERLSTITVKTKLLHSDVFSDECGNDVYIKPNNTVQMLYYLARFMTKPIKRRWSCRKSTAMCSFIRLMMKM